MREAIPLFPHTSRRGSWWGTTLLQLFWFCCKEWQIFTCIACNIHVISRTHVAYVLKKNTSKERPGVFLVGRP